MIPCYHFLPAEERIKARAKTERMLVILLIVVPGVFSLFFIPTLLYLALR